MSASSTQIVASTNAVVSRKIYAVIEDLFFLAKIQETARKLGVQVEFVKTDRDLLPRLEAEPAPALIIVDLNNANAKPVAMISKVRHNSALKKTSLVGFVSHLDADLKHKAQEAGCDMVMPRSAFSQNLPALLRRHGLPEA